MLLGTPRKSSLCVSYLLLSHKLAEFRHLNNRVMNLCVALWGPLSHKAVVKGIGQSLSHHKVQLEQDPLISSVRFLGVGRPPLVPCHMGLSIGQFTTWQLPSSK